MKYKLFFGLCGWDGNFLYSPSCKYKIPLPDSLGEKIQTFLNHNLAYTCQAGTYFVWDRKTWKKEKV